MAGWGSLPEAEAEDEDENEEEKKKNHGNAHEAESCAPLLLACGEQAKRINHQAIFVLFNLKI